MHVPEYILKFEMQGDGCEGCPCCQANDSDEYFCGAMPEGMDCLVALDMDPCSGAVSRRGSLGIRPVWCPLTKKPSKGSQKPDAAEALIAATAETSARVQEMKAINKWLKRAVKTPLD
jgi:hypothetical protein